MKTLGIPFFASALALAMFSCSSEEEPHVHYSGASTFHASYLSDPITVTINGQNQTLSSASASTPSDCALTGNANFSFMLEEPSSSLSYSATDGLVTWTGNLTVTDQGCTKVALENPLVMHRWKIVKATASPGIDMGGTVITDVTDMMFEPCQKDDNYEFHKNGDILLIYKDMLCSWESGTEEVISTWTLENAVLTFIDGTDETPMTVLSLSDDAFSIKLPYDDPSWGTPQEVTIDWVRVD